MLALTSMVVLARGTAQVLVLTITAIFFGSSSGGTASMADYVGDAVNDAERSQAAVEVAEKIDAKLAETRTKVVELRRETLQQMSGTDWTAAGLAARFEVFDRVLAATSSELVILRQELKRAMTAEEWQAMFVELEENLQARAGS